jgi:hypothetical protein
MFLWDNKDRLPVKEASAIESVLSERAEFWRVKAEFNALKKEFSKKASYNPYKDLPDSEFALVLDFADGKKERHYPLRNSTEVKIAAQYLRKFNDVIPFKERQKIAQKILDKANDHNTDLGREAEYLDKQAGYGVCSAEDAADMLMSRSAMLRALKKMPELAGQLEKMAKTCLEHPEQVRARSSLVKLASIVDDLDRGAGLSAEYDKRLSRPEDILFGVTIKAAEHLVNDHCETITGNLYKLADLRKVDLDALRGVFGDDFAESVSAGGLLVSPEKLAEQMFALPRPDVELLDKILSQAGINPVMRKSAASTSNQWKNRRFLQNLSDERQI